MPFLRVTQNGQLTLINSDRVVKMDATNIEGMNSILTFLPGVNPQQFAIDQTLTQLSTALTAVSVGGA